MKEKIQTLFDTNGLDLRHLKYFEVSLVLELMETAYELGAHDKTNEGCKEKSDLSYWVK